MTHICVSKLTIIGSDNGLSPDRRQAIIRTSAGILLIGPLGTNFSEIVIEILTFSFKEMRLKVSSAKRRPFCLGLNVFTKSHYQCRYWLVTEEGMYQYPIQWWRSLVMRLRPRWVNSLAPGKFDWHFRYVILEQILVIDGRGISCEIALI